VTLSPHLQVGYVAKAHGLQGEVVIRTFDPASRVLFDVERARVRRRDGTEMNLTVEDARSTAKELIVAFAEVGTREQAEELVGATVFVFREELEPPKHGEFFQGDLVGLQAVSEDGRPLGKVEEIWTTGEVPTLVIRQRDEELLVPFAEDFVGEVDIERRLIVVRPPEVAE
jgi:16S rRNA processing protein RimM